MTKRTITISDITIDNYLLGIGFIKPYNTKEDALEFKDPDNNFHLEIFDSLTQSYKHIKSNVILKRTRIHAKKSYRDEGEYGDFVFSEKLRFEKNKIFVELSFDPNKPAHAEAKSSDEELTFKISHEIHRFSKDKKLQFLIGNIYGIMNQYESQRRE